jgi:hypothetical protein
VPELEFKEEKPLKAPGVAPTMAKQAQIEVAAEAQEPKVRFAEWKQCSDEPYASFASRFPIWLFVALSVGVWLAIILVLLPQQLVRGSAFDPGQEPNLTPSTMSAVIMFGVLTAGFTGAAIHSFVYQLRIRRRLNHEIEAPATLRRPARSGSFDLHGQMRVSMMLAQRGIVYGEDVGNLTFDGNSLYFQGMQTTFSIAKERLTLKPFGPRAPKSSTFSYTPPHLLRLTYEESGVEHELGFFQWGFHLSDGPSPLMQALKEWHKAPAPPVVSEVLPPRDMPKSALSAALRSMFAPILVAEGLGYMVAIGLQSMVLAHGHPHSVSTSSPALAWLHSFQSIVLAVEIVAIGYIASFRPLKQAIRRYRFVKYRS